MIVGGLRLMLAGLWLLLGAAILLREPLGLAGLERFAGPNAPMMGAVAVALGLWNVARWRASRRPEPYTVVRPRDEAEEERPYEYNPEFDFTRPEEKRE